MERRAYLILAVTVAAWLAVSGSARANAWTPNLPLSEHPREWYTVMVQSWSGLYERVQMTGATNLPYRAGWDGTNFSPRYQWTNLCSFKKTAKDLITGGKYLVAAPNGQTYPIFLASNGEVRPYTTLTGVCAAASLPTNFFDYTPPRGLDGIGGQTQYVAQVGHWHGGTNAQTAAGGPYLPSGRTLWLTTDYGWDNFRKVFPELTVTWVAWKSGTNAFYEGAMGTNLVPVNYNPYPYLDFGIACEAAKLFAEDDWSHLYDGNGHASYEEWAWTQTQSPHPPGGGYEAYLSERTCRADFVLPYTGAGVDPLTVWVGSANLCTTNTTATNSIVAGAVAGSAITAARGSASVPYGIWCDCPPNHITGADIPYQEARGEFTHFLSQGPPNYCYLLWTGTSF